MMGSRISILNLPRLRTFPLLRLNSRSSSCTNRRGSQRQQHDQLAGTPRRNKWHIPNLTLRSLRWRMLLTHPIRTLALAHSFSNCPRHQACTPAPTRHARRPSPHYHFLTPASTSNNLSISMPRQGPSSTNQLQNHPKAWLA